MKFKENLSSQNQIMAHLKACDPEFYQALSGRVDISEYSQKLAQKSFRHEAWRGDELIGLIAVYYNHNPAGFDFITDVSVIQSALGRGVASKLLHSCIEKARAGGSAEIRLEVDSGNESALNLYNKFGFTRHGENAGNLVLRLKFED